MKNISRILILGSVLFFRPAEAAIFPDYTPLLPVAPQICAQCTPAAISTVTSTIDQINAMEEKLKGANLIKMVQQSATSYAVELGKSKFNALKQKITQKKKVVSASRVIEDSTLTVAGDISDEGKVKEAFITLFMQYPSKNGSKMKQYEENSKQLSMDTTLEMYITARELNKELTTMMAQLDKIENCLVAGEDCTEMGLGSKDCQSEGKEDKVCIWNNALAAVRIYDKIMRYNEFLTAMNAQYNAVRSIGGTAKIKEYVEEKKSEKQSFLEDKYQKGGQVTAYAYNMITLADASVDEDSQFDTLDDAGLESPVAGKEKEFDSLEIIADAKKAMNEAISAHNFKKSLPQYRNVFEMYNNLADYQHKTARNVAISVSCISNYLVYYYKNPDKAWSNVNCLRHEEGLYQCHYSPEKNFSDKSASVGDYDIACWDDKDKKCYVVSSAKNIKGKKGIEKWLMALKESARDKAEESKGDLYENGSYMSEATDFSDSGNTSLSDMKAKADAGYADDKQGSNVKSLKKPSLEDDMYAENRANALMNWTLGKQASEMINEEYVSGKTTFGQLLAGAGVLWNDQKYFYDDYISGKYENIKAYIDNTTFVDLLAKAAKAINENYPYKAIRDAAGRVVKTPEKQREEAAEAIEKFVASAAAEPDSAELDALLAAEKESLTALTNEYLNKVKTLQNSKTPVYSSMDEASTKYSDMQDEINKEKSTVSTADTEMPKSEDAIKEGESLERGTETSPQRAAFNKNIAGNEKNKEAAVKKLESLKLSAENLKQQIEASRARLEQIDKDIYQAKAAYVAAYNEAQTASRQAINEAAKAYEEARKDYVKQISSAASKVTVLAIADDLLQAAKAKAIAKVEETYTGIAALGDSKYLASGAKNIAEKHTELLQYLQNLGLDPQDGDYGSYGDYISTYNEMYAPLVKDKFNADSEYFWGIVERQRDFYAPKSPLDFSEAPVREVFHFDMDDYDAVIKYFKDGIDSTPENNEDVTLVGNSLLLSGLELPDIWRTLLAYRPYVERDIDFDKLFHPENVNNAEVLAGSGIYPCRMNGKNITATAGGYANATVSSGRECTHLANSRDEEAGAAISVNGSVNTAQWHRASELGQLLDYVVQVKMVGPFKVEKVGHLSFNSALLKAVSMIKKSDKLDGSESNESESASRDYYMYSRFLFDRNQFGDYLDMVDINDEAAKALVLQKTQVDELRAQLKEVLESMGYTISDDFDLSNENDYKKVSDTLKKYKTAYLRQLTDLLQTITGTTELIVTNKEKLVHAKEVMEKDSEEEVSISGEEDLDELEEKIKTARADQSLTDVYEKEGNSSMEKQTKQLRPPFCAVYPY